ncbi:MAG: Mrp/NBP35 family ATP-binding protein [Planctomycetaceae bacterium]
MSGTVAIDPAIAACLKDVQDPEIGKSLECLHMIRQAQRVDGGVVRVEIELPTPAYPQRERITERIQQAIGSELDDVERVDVNFDWSVQGKDTGGALGLRIKNVIAVGSGKGGVGKSTVAASLAFGLQSFGARVGLMDADVYGPSLPHMLGASGQPAAVERLTESGETITRIEPIEADGVKMMSMGFFVDPDQAVVWRGPMLHKALTQFLKDTEWGELDYLVIDLPPGTGDVALTLSQLLGLAGAVVVCTPQQVALLDAVKAINMYRQVKVPLLGIVENMTGEVFGRGGAQRKAAEMGIPFLGEIPINAEIRVSGDAGRMADLYSDQSEVRSRLLSVCEQTAMQIARQVVDSPQAPTLEIL